MTQEPDVKLNNERKSFSKTIKRKVLLEYSKGKKVNSIVRELLFENLEEMTNDDKYASKLIHKWRQEYYIHREILNSTLFNPTDEFLEYELENIDLTEKEEQEADTELFKIISKFDLDPEEEQKKRNKGEFYTQY